MNKKKPAKPIKDKDLVLDIQDYLRYKNERDYILFILGIGTGYRAGDLVKLKVRDVKEAIKEEYFTILEGKKVNTRNIRKENIKPRTVPLVDKLKKILKEYIKNKKDYEYLFPSRKGVNKPINVSRVSVILDEAGKQFGLSDISSHSMRKTYAYKIYMESDKNIDLVKDMLGQSSREITERYLGLDRELYDSYSAKLNDLIR
jgi:integrase